jgi:N-acetylglutamate synthase-like GNAT family acetyltransferase
MTRNLQAYAVDGTDKELQLALVAADLPVDDLADAGRAFLRFEKAGRVVGYGGFELHGEHALIRSIVVLPEVRGTGAGRRIAEAVIAEAGRQGARDAYLLTTSAAAFFSHLGFSVIDRAAAPVSILGTRQATTICSSAALLSRRIHD